MFGTNMEVVWMSDDEVSLEAGAGGLEMIKLLKESVFPSIEVEENIPKIGIEEMDDGAVINLEGTDKYLVFTTDSHLVKPRFFPGGDLGKLAVCGTINDLAVMGADPIALSSSIVLEKGFPREELERISESMGKTAEGAGVPIVTGDTKVAGEGDVDGIIVNTSGVGICDELTPASGLNPGDKIIVSGNIGDHGMSIVADREDFEFDIESDVAPVHELVQKIKDVGGVTAIKDPTRGGLAASLNEMASASGVDIEVEKEDIPIDSKVEGAGEMLGIDPLKIANEGKIVVGVDPSKAQRVLESLRSEEAGKNSQIIGECVGEGDGRVLLNTEIGSSRMLKTPRREPVPRIC